MGFEDRLLAGRSGAQYYGAAETDSTPSGKLPASERRRTYRSRFRRVIREPCSRWPPLYYLGFTANAHRGLWCSRGGWQHFERLSREAAASLSGQYGSVCGESLGIEAYTRGT